MLKKVQPIALIALASVAGCGSRNVDAAKESVERQLLDPGSAQYRDLRAFSEDVVCGSVNSKNRLGGYVGFKTFIYNGPRAKEADFDVDQEEVDLWCSDKENKRKTAADRDNERRSHTGRGR